MFSYCPKCSGKLRKRSHLLDICESCGFDFYHNPIPAATLIAVNQNHHVLLTRRAHEPFKDTWDLPGGFLEPFETAEEALKREILEELSVEIEDIRYFGSYHEKYPSQEMMFPVISLVYTAKLKSARFQPADDISEAEFFSHADTEKLSIEFPMIRKAIKDFYLQKDGSSSY